MASVQDLLDKTAELNTEVDRVAVLVQNLEQQGGITPEQLDPVLAALQAVKDKIVAIV